MPLSHDCNGWDDGVGLTELLVSLALMALISLLILQGVGTGRHLWRGMSARAETAEAIQSAQVALRARMEGIYPQTLFDRSVAYVDFAGDGLTMSFLGPPSAAQAGALRRYILQVTPAGELVLLSRSDLWRNFMPPFAPQYTREVLLRGVRGLNIAYFENRGWRMSWSKQPRLPALIRLRVAFPAGDKRWWPDLIVHPAVTVDSDCSLNQGGGNCAMRL